MAKPQNNIISAVAIACHILYPQNIHINLRSHTQIMHNKCEWNFFFLTSIKHENFAVFDDDENLLVYVFERVRHKKNATVHPYIYKGKYFSKAFFVSCLTF